MYVAANDMSLVMSHVTLSYGTTSTCLWIDMAGYGDAIPYKQASERSSFNQITPKGASSPLPVTRVGVHGEEFRPCVHRNGY